MCHCVLIPILTCPTALAAKTESVEVIDQIPKTTQAPPGRDVDPDGERCSCSSSKEDIDARKREKETESENELNFEDQLHNMIYIRRFVLLLVCIDIKLFYKFQNF